MYYYSLFLEHPNSFNQYITRKKAKKKTLNINEAELAHPPVKFQETKKKRQHQNTQKHLSMIDTNRNINTCTIYAFTCKLR